MGRPEEAKGELSAPLQDAPPPYSEPSAGASGAPPSAPASLDQVKQQQQQPTAPSGAEPAPQSQQQPQQQHINRQFPPAFSMYRGGTFSRTHYIGEHQTQPLYAVTTHSGWSGQPDVVLHSSADPSSPPLAGVDSNTFSRSATVELPPLPGSGRGSAQETVDFSGWAKGLYHFSVEVGATSAGRREHYEWRHSHGSEVDSLGGRSAGWKLVRLATDAPGDAEGAQFVPGGAKSSRDGKEVVAVWANASMSMSKEFNFRFLGSGANGVLGERWAVMAVITALRIWDRERKARQNAGAGAGAAASG